MPNGFGLAVFHRKHSAQFRSLAPVRVCPVGADCRCEPCARPLGEHDPHARPEIGRRGASQPSFSPVRGLCREVFFL